METLFHEFGHTLQNLLTETKLQHVSGSRTYMDFVETPSTLMEYFVFDPRLMPLWAKKADGTLDHWLVMECLPVKERIGVEVRVRVGDNSVLPPGSAYLLNSILLFSRDANFARGN